MAGTRWGGALPAGAAGFLADLDLGGWLLGAHGRWDGYAATMGTVGYATQALEAGADVGRDLRIGGTSLTLLAGPRFVALWQKLQSTPPSVYDSALNPKTGMAIGSVVPSARDGQVVRFGGTARWTVLSGIWSLFVAVDAEVDVTSDQGNRVPAALAATDPLPVWSAGLSLGGAVTVSP
jgi:hypothetical protein